MNKINQRVKKLRKQNKYSQKNIGNLLGMKTSTYSQMEREGNFNGDELVLLADFFKVDVKTFLYDDIPETPVIIEIPDDYYQLNRREYDLITMYRCVNKESKAEIFKFAYEQFKARRQKRKHSH
ncbi:MAG: helix-turn-helix domain-containing protein [Clostridia bacterium]|nr:helix-turn-helix domain-containing protein [Clostridia bacterium]